jgi:hypothetical protein
MTLVSLMVVVAGFVTMTSDPALSRLALPSPQQQSVEPSIGGPFVNAGIGTCSTEFAVKDANGRPAPSARIHMHLHYGLMGLRRMELVIGTGSDGRARVTGLPERASWLLYEIENGRTTTQLPQDLSRACRGRYDVTLR